MVTSDGPFVRQALHPAASLALWGFALVLAMGAPFRIAFAVAICMSLIALGLARRQFTMLLRRSRWLLMSLVLVLSLMTPGISMLGGLSFLAPTREGFWFAIDQGSRLVLALAMLSILFALVSQGQLLAGMRSLLVTMGIPCRSANRAALRLALTLQALQSARNPPASRSWWQWLHANSSSPLHVKQSMSEATDSPIESIIVPDYPMNRTDKILVWFCLVSATTIGAAMIANPGATGGL